MKRITPEEAQSIIDIACKQWEDELAIKWGADIVKRRPILISDDYYRRMRAACTSEQHLLFDKIFGKSWSNLKPGDYVLVDAHSERVIPRAAATGVKTKEGIVLQVVEQKRDLFKVKNDHSCMHSRIIRMATEEEIALYKFRPGTYWRNKGHKEEIIKIKRVVPETTNVEYENITVPGRAGVFLITSAYEKSLSPVTEEEVKKYTAIPKGVLCLVRDDPQNSWMLRYSAGNGEVFSWNNTKQVTYKFKETVRFDLNCLPDDFKREFNI